MQRTKIEYYYSQAAANRGIARNERRGYRVISVQTIDRGWSLIKTGCLGLIFLPLALLGKKKPVIQVTYQSIR
ncbi:MAG: hypothetical protein PHW11_02885 [Anaerolineaceae bacterium]|jgi:hypothetical protein|nr:hypothetical protein [Anaerolineaceae bacterium]MDD4043544.1 hypothetical protein [Anaerolineaceae bacterium]MDD4577929.1 hypothetical protein [Anaerolineaceae bacterium]